MYILLYDSVAWYVSCFSVGNLRICSNTIRTIDAALSSLRLRRQTCKEVRDDLWCVCVWDVSIWRLTHADLIVRIENRIRIIIMKKDRRSHDDDDGAWWCGGARGGGANLMRGLQLLRSVTNQSCVIRKYRPSRKNEDSNVGRRWTAVYPDLPSDGTDR
jgi:hypothetical protein